MSFIFDKVHLQNCYVHSMEVKLSHFTVPEYMESFRQLDKNKSVQESLSGYLKQFGPKTKLLK